MSSRNGVDVFKLNTKFEEVKEEIYDSLDKIDDEIEEIKGEIEKLKRSTGSRGRSRAPSRAPSIGGGRKKRVTRRKV